MHHALVLLECLCIFGCPHGNRKQEEAQYVPHAAETAAFEEASNPLHQLTQFASIHDSVCVFVCVHVCDGMASLIGTEGNGGKTGCRIWKRYR